MNPLGPSRWPGSIGPRRATQAGEQSQSPSQDGIGPSVPSVDLPNPQSLREATRYTQQLQPLEKLHPGLSRRLLKAEKRAWLAAGLGSTIVDQLMQSPPWPQRSYGDRRANIEARASQLQRQFPELAQRGLEGFDFTKAQQRAEELFQELADLFPTGDFPGCFLVAQVKTPSSLEKKLAGRPEHETLAHLTDGVRARLDSCDLAGVGKTAHRLEDHFQGRIIAKRDYFAEPSPWGYRALHYVLDGVDRMSEIQLSTHDLRATDLATHDTLYKPKVSLAPEVEERLKGAGSRIMLAECWRYLGGVP